MVVSLLLFDEDEEDELLKRRWVTSWWWWADRDDDENIVIVIVLVVVDVERVWAEADATMLAAETAVEMPKIRVKICRDDQDDDE